MNQPTPVTLVTGSTAVKREAAIATLLADKRKPCATNESDFIAIILEGISDGTDPFESIANNFLSLSIMRIAPGCPCCIGNLTMRVTLNRILRHPPEQIYISLAAHSHLAQVRTFLVQPPYDNLLNLTKEIHV